MHFTCKTLVKGFVYPKINLSFCDSVEAELTGLVTGTEIKKAVSRNSCVSELKRKTEEWEYKEDKPCLQKYWWLTIL